MNKRGRSKIIREHYPVAKLPVDLQKDIASFNESRLTIETSAPRKALLSFGEIFARLDQMRSDGTIQTITDEEAVARIRALRDEWDD